MTLFIIGSLLSVKKCVRKWISNSIKAFKINEHIKLDNFKSSNGWLEKFIMTSLVHKLMRYV